MRAVCVGYNYPYFLYVYRLSQTLEAGFLPDY